MRSIIKIFLPTALAALLSSGSASAAALVSYSFHDGLDPTASDPNVVVNSVTLPGGFDVSTSTDMVFFQSNLSSSDLAGALSGGSDATADYLTFTIRAAAGQTLSLTSLTFDHFISNANANFTSNLSVFASLNDFATAPTAGSELATSTASTGDTISGSDPVVYNDDFTVSLSDPAFQNLTSATTVTFRIYGFDNLDISGNINRLDNLVVNGTVIPEPATVLLSAIGALGLLRRKR